MNKQYKYSLAKKGKWICPQCGHKTFVCYVDENGNVLDESVGKCDRADKCNHHYPPREYFQDNNLPVPRPSSVVRPFVPAYVPPSYIEPEILKRSVENKGNHLNCFLRYLEDFAGFEAEKIQRMKSEYYIGAAKHWRGATVFWQVDRFGKVHAGKIMLYDIIQGKRVKKPFNHVTWAHTVMGLTNFNLKQCLFGEHLLDKYPDKPVAVVESEKTAAILGVVMPSCVAVACGGCGNLTPTLCEPLKGRDVILFPDNGKYKEWTEKGKSMAHMFKRLWISAFAEHLAPLQGEGSDIADYILKWYDSWTREYDGEVPINLSLKQLK